MTKAYIFAAMEWLAALNNAAGTAKLITASRRAHTSPRARHHTPTGSIDTYRRPLAFGRALRHASNFMDIFRHRGR